MSRSSPAASFVLAAFCALAAAYAFRIAPGNAPDERAHAEYAAAVSGGRLPVWNWPREPYSYEAVQPPLYYLPGGLWLRLSRGLSPLSRLRGLRLISLLMHLAALLALRRISLRLEGNRRAALGPLCAAAFLPMFGFIGASVTNDAAADLFGAWLLWLAVCAEQAPRARRPWLLGLLAGAGLLSKSTVLPVAAVCGWSLWRRREMDGSGLLKASALALLACGWAYGRNIGLYGDPLGLSRLRLYDPNRYEWAEAGRWLLFYFQSFWGRFGQMTQPMPACSYGAAAAFSLAAFSGWILRWRELLRLPGRGMLAAACFLCAAQNAYYGFFLSSQPQARHSFVALAAWAVLFWDGLSAWGGRLAPRWRLAALWLAGGGAALLQWAAWRSL